MSDSTDKEKSISELAAAMAIPPKIFGDYSEFKAPELPSIELPTQEEINDYRSASVFMEAFAKEALAWKEQLPEEYEPAILAILYGGIQINVHSLAKVSFHGIRIEGSLNGAPCSLLAHQSTIQMLCHGMPVEEEEPRRPIGFIWDGHEVEV